MEGGGQSERADRRGDGLRENDKQMDRWGLWEDMDIVSRVSLKALWSFESGFTTGFKCRLILFVSFDSSVDIFEMRMKD